MLLEAGADPNLTGMVPQKVSGVVKVLLEAGADPNLTGMVPQKVSRGGEGAAGADP